MLAPYEAAGTVYHFMSAQAGYSVPGLDFFICAFDSFVGIETKAPTARQELTIKTLRRAGAKVFVIDNVEGTARAQGGPVTLESTTMNQIVLSTKRKLIGAPTDDALKALFPTAPEIDIGGVSYVIVPHDETTTHWLRYHGHEAPAPILTYYRWPGDKKPFEVQKKTCELLTLNSRAYVLNSMGTGKTKAALWAWDHLRSIGLAGKLLVVAPLSTVQFTWAHEVMATVPHRKYAILHGDKAKRLERLSDPDVEVFIINHDGVSVILDELQRRTDIDCLVLDELAVYRNPGTARFKMMKKYAASMKWVWGMTGAPIPNAPTDAWAQCAIITPARVPKFFGRFREDLCIKVSQFKWAPKSDAVDKVYRVMQPAVRFTLDDIDELPEQSFRTMDVGMGPVQAKAYKDLANDLYATIQTQTVSAANQAVMMQKLLQVALGWVYTTNRGVVPLDNNERIEALIDCVESTDRKVLVFSPFKHCLDGIGKALAKEKIEYATVSGDTPAGVRADIFNAFQNTTKYRVLNAHPKCLAHGLTLTAADTIVWFGPTLSLDTFDQANARIHRVGQQHKQQVILLQGTKVEQRIYAMLRSKHNVQEKLLGLFEEATK
jgi:SNF2 family DNA or RNA helicase